jgi:two-component SAPR family response regulator
LVKKETIVSLAKANPEFLLEKNANGKTPLDLIPEMIESMEETIKGEYLKCAEYGWANSNIWTLKNIKKELIEALDAYAN